MVQLTGRAKSASRSAVGSCLYSNRTWAVMLLEIRFAGCLQGTGFNFSTRTTILSRIKSDPSWTRMHVLRPPISFVVHQSLKTGDTESLRSKGQVLWRHD